MLARQVSGALYQSRWKRFIRGVLSLRRTLHTAVRTRWLRGRWTIDDGRWTMDGLLLSSLLSIVHRHGVAAARLVASRYARPWRRSGSRWLPSAHSFQALTKMTGSSLPARSSC